MSVHFIEACKECVLKNLYSLLAQYLAESMQEWQFSPLGSIRHTWACAWGINRFKNVPLPTINIEQSQQLHTYTKLLTMWSCGSKDRQKHFPLVFTSNPFELLVVSTLGNGFEHQTPSPSHPAINCPHKTPSQATVSKTLFSENTATSDKAKMVITISGEMQVGINGMFILKSQFS